MKHIRLFSSVSARFVRKNDREKTPLSAPDSLPEALREGVFEASEAGKAYLESLVRNPEENYTEFWNRLKREIENDYKGNPTRAEELWAMAQQAEMAFGQAFDALSITKETPEEWVYAFVDAVKEIIKKEVKKPREGFPNGFTEKTDEERILGSVGQRVAYRVMQQTPAIQGNAKLSEIFFEQISRFNANGHLYAFQEKQNVNINGVPVWTPKFIEAVLSVEMQPGTDEQDMPKLANKAETIDGYQDILNDENITQRLFDKTGKYRRKSQQVDTLEFTAIKHFPTLKSIPGAPADAYRGDVLINQAYSLMPYSVKDNPAKGEFNERAETSIKNVRLVDYATADKLGILPQFEAIIKDIATDEELAKFPLEDMFFYTFQIADACGMHSLAAGYSVLGAGNDGIGIGATIREEAPADDNPVVIEENSAVIIEEAEITEEAEEVEEKQIEEGDPIIINLGNGGNIEEGDAIIIKQNDVTQDRKRAANQSVDAGEGAAEARAAQAKNEEMLFGALASIADSSDVYSELNEATEAQKQQLVAENVINKVIDALRYYVNQTKGGLVGGANRLRNQWLNVLKSMPKPEQEEWNTILENMEGAMAENIAAEMLQFSGGANAKKIEKKAKKKAKGLRAEMRTLVLYLNAVEQYCRNSGEDYMREGEPLFQAKTFFQAFAKDISLAPELTQKQTYDGSDLLKDGVMMAVNVASVVVSAIGKNPVKMLSARAGGFRDYRKVDGINTIDVDDLSEKMGLTILSELENLANAEVHQAIGAMEAYMADPTTSAADKKLMAKVGLEYFKAYQNQALMAVPESRKKAQKTFNKAARKERNAAWKAAKSKVHTRAFPDFSTAKESVLAMDEALLKNLWERGRASLLQYANAVYEKGLVKQLFYPAWRERYDGFHALVKGADAAYAGRNYDTLRDNLAALVDYAEEDFEVKAYTELDFGSEPDWPNKSLGNGHLTMVPTNFKHKGRIVLRAAKNPETGAVTVGYYRAKPEQKLKQFFGGRMTEPSQLERIPLDELSDKEGAWAAVRGNWEKLYKDIREVPGVDHLSGFLSRDPASLSEPEKAQFAKDYKAVKTEYLDAGIGLVAFLEMVSQAHYPQLHSALRRQIAVMEYVPSLHKESNKADDFRAADRAMMRLAYSAKTLVNRLNRAETAAAYLTEFAADEDESILREWGLVNVLSAYPSFEDFVAGTGVYPIPQSPEMAFVKAYYAGEGIDKTAAKGLSKGFVAALLEDPKQRAKAIRAYQRVSLRAQIGDKNTGPQAKPGDHGADLSDLINEEIRGREAALVSLSEGLKGQIVFNLETTMVGEMTSGEAIADSITQSTSVPIPTLDVLYDAIRHNTLYLSHAYLEAYFAEMNADNRDTDDVVLNMKPLLEELNPEEGIIVFTVSVPHQQRNRETGTWSTALRTFTVALAETCSNYIVIPENTPVSEIVTEAPTPYIGTQTFEQRDIKDLVLTYVNPRYLKDIFAEVFAGEDPTKSGSRNIIRELSNMDRTQIEQLAQNAGMTYERFVALMNKDNLVVEAIKPIFNEVGEVVGYETTAAITDTVAGQMVDLSGTISMGLDAADPLSVTNMFSSLEQIIADTGVDEAKLNRLIDKIGYSAFTSGIMSFLCSSFNQDGRAPITAGAKQYALPASPF